MLPPPLCTSFNVAEIIEKIGEVAIFPRWLSLPNPKAENGG
jgi:hypothetical protein